MFNRFYTNPRLSVLLVGFVLILGAVSYASLARQEDPTMTERWASVSTFLPGAAAERVESLVSEPIENALREIPEIKVLESNSRAGYSIVTIELYDRVLAGQTDVVWAEVRDKLGEVHPQLPADSSAPLLEMRAPLAATLIVGLEWTLPGEPELGVLSRLADTLETRFASVPGTKETEIYGEAEEEILVSLDPYRLAAAGLASGDVARRVAAADTKSAAGRLRGPVSDLLVEVDGELDSVERIARIPLKTDGAAVLRVADLGTVTRAAVDPPRTLALHGDRRSVLVAAKMEPEQRIDLWLANAERSLETFRADLPRGVSAEVLYNQNDYTGARLADLGRNLLWALVIVMLTLLWFMGARSALTVGIALPLSGALVLGLLKLTGVPLHQMSVTGLIISLGLLIDNAIVVVEEYKLKRRRGLAIADAIEAAVRHLLVPLGASTATTVFAFMTIAMAPGGTGDFTGTIGLAVVFAVASSYLLAMTVVPALAGFAERRWPERQPGAAGRWWQHGYSNARLTAGYRRLLTVLLRRPLLALAVGGLLPLLGFALAPTLTQQFFPPVDRNQFQIQLKLPPHASIQETRAAVTTAETILRADPRVTDSHWTLGEGAPRTFYNVVAQNDGVASFAGAWVDTVSSEATRQLLPGLQRTLSAALPHAQVLALPFEQGPPFDAPLEIRVVGPDLGQLRRISDELRLLMAGIDDVSYTAASISAAEPKLVFRPRENPTAAVGLATGDLPRQLNDALVGTAAGTVQEGNTEIDVRVRLGNGARDDVHDLASLPLAAGGGAAVPLDQLGDWRLEPAVSGIQRYQGERTSEVHGFLAPFVLPAAAMAEFRARLDASGLTLPAGFRLDIGGEEEQRTESVGGLLSVFVLFAVLMGIVVTLSLNSFRQAALIGLVGLLSFGLALFGVRLFGYPLGFMAIIGGLGMVGLAINGAIIVLSALKADPAANRGDRDAAAAVVLDASRHILSTTATTIGGFLPLILFGGTFWPPLATAIAGGVGGSAVLALLTVPSLFVAMARRRQRRAPAQPEGTDDRLLHAA